MDVSEELRLIESPWRCDHPQTEPRLRTLSNGTKAIYLQCLRCGSGKGSALPRAKVKLPVADWDLDLEESFRAAARQAIEEQKATERRERERQYGEYLRTAEWRERRELVLKRANYLCEGCGKRPAVQAHHTTYEHIRNEFLWELRAVCIECHERFHGIDDLA